MARVEELSQVPLLQRDLQQQLEERGLPKTGNKKELATRLYQDLQEERSMLLGQQAEAMADLQRQYKEVFQYVASMTAILALL